MRGRGRGRGAEGEGEGACIYYARARANARARASARVHNIRRGRGQGGEGEGLREGEGQCTGEERCKHATNCVQARSGTACKHAAHASGEASAASTRRTACKHAAREQAASETLHLCECEFSRQNFAPRSRCESDLSRTHISSTKTPPCGKYETIISKIFLKGYCLSERCATYVVFRLVFLRGPKLHLKKDRTKRRRRATQLLGTLSARAQSSEESPGERISAT